MTDNIDQQIQTIATEARAGYDLKTRAQGRKLRTGSITVFTNEEAGAEHKKVVAEIASIKRNARDAIVDPETHVVLIEASPLDEEALAAAEARKAELEAELDASAFTFQWRAVPPLIEKEARRKALAKFTHGNDLVPTSDQPDFKDWFATFIFAKAVRRFRDHGEGVTVETFSHEDAQTVQELLLPRTEWERMYERFSEDQFATAIEYEATDSPDF